jgi:biopolymer transport protein ExbB
MATGIGIAVAVPAVLAYNVFLRRLKIINADMDELGADLISLSHKSRFRIARSKPVAAVSNERSAAAPRHSSDKNLLPAGTQPA